MAVAKIIADTNIISYIMKNSREADAYKKHLAGRLISISFITVGELFYGAENANWGLERKRKLEETIRNFVVIPYDHEIAKTYGKVMVERKRLGLPILLHDAWIAACAVRHSVPLVTHNPGDFENIKGLEIITEKQK